jgi:hypothetical protein
METVFTVEQARALIPGVQEKLARLQPLRADLAELGSALAAGRPSDIGGMPEHKALEAALHELLGWFTEQGIQVKGIAPLLIDFPADFGARRVLLCWLEGESGLDWYHDPALGFMGRRRIEGA